VVTDAVTAARRDRVVAAKQAAYTAIDAIDGEVQELSARIHANPELGYEEHQASAWVAGLLAAHGFAVQKPVAGLPTAFRATWRGTGSHAGGPRIALLAEYDALPDVGHGCGHNLIASASAAAAVALKDSYPDFPGSIEVYGTPAEEGGGGKIVMLDAGVFDGVDVGLMFHPGVQNTVNAPSLAMTALTITFTGRPAHAAVGPWEGVNAADAAMLFFAGVNALRQQIRPDARLHGVIREAGSKPNIIPARAVVDFMVRADRAEDMLPLVERVVDIARGAELMTGATVGIDRGKPYLDYRVSPSLGAAAETNFAALGVPTAPITPDTAKASEDAGNLSHVLPFLPISVSISDEPIPGHSAQWREAAISPKGAWARQIAAKVLAATSIDLAHDPALLARATAEQRAAVA
jgi:amidohydrolase